MIYRKSRIPLPSKGLVNTAKKIVVPDQSMSLQEILTRFTRGEPLAVAHPEAYGGNEDLEDELNLDLEKVAKSDLTERDELAEKIRGIRDEHEKAEKTAKQKKAEAQAKAKAEADEKRILDEVEKRTKATGKVAS